MTENMHPEHPAPKRSGGNAKWIIGGVAVIAVIGLGSSLAGKDAADAPPAETVAVYEPAPHPSEQAPLVAPAPEQVEAARGTIDRDGMFKVGTDLAPGEYVVTMTDPNMGYYELCSAPSCSLEIDGTGTMLANEMVLGDGYLTVGPEVAYVKLRGVSITPAD